MFRVFFVRLCMFRGAFALDNRPSRMPRVPPPIEERLPVLLAFGHAVRQARKAQGFSQEAFADHCGIDRSYMGCVERGERNLALVNIEKIIKALGMEPSEFFKALDKPTEGV